MRSVTLTASSIDPGPWDGLTIQLAELHTLQVLASTRLELAAGRTHDLLGAPEVATWAALEIADLLRIAGAALGRCSITAQEVRRGIARMRAERLA